MKNDKPQLKGVTPPKKNHFPNKKKIKKQTNQS